VAVGRGTGPGLAHPGIEAEVADELARALEAADVADRGEEARGDDHVDAGHAHQPPDLAGLERALRDQSLDRGDLRVQELDLADRGVDGLALLDRQLDAGEPAPALDAEQVGDRWAADELAHQHRVDLILRARARATQLAAAC
jgi:hypothetical protein